MVCNWFFSGNLYMGLFSSHGSMAKWWEVTGITWKKSNSNEHPDTKRELGTKPNFADQNEIHVMRSMFILCILPLDPVITSINMTIMWRPQSWPTTTCQAANTGRHRGCFSFLNAKHHQHKAAVWQSYGSFQVLSNYGNWVAATKPCYTRRTLLYNCLLKMFVLQFGSTTPCKTTGGHRVWSLLNFTDCHAHPYG